MELVLENAESWSECFRVWCARLPYGDEVTGEDLRYAAVEVIGEPHHPNAWGGAIAGAIKSGYIHKTGERRQMKDPKSHARTTDVYITGWWKGNEE